MRSVALGRRQDGLGPRSGLTLTEVLVVLVISSLVLSLALPMAGRAVRDNLRMSTRGLSAEALSIQEQTFRLILASAVQPDLTFATGSGQRSVATAWGDSANLVLTILPVRNLGCARAGRRQPITLHLQSTSPDIALVMICEGSSARVGEFAAANAAFSYSETPGVWRDSVAPDASYGSGAAGNLVAPLVRLRATGSGSDVAWIERAGRAALVEYGVDAEFADRSLRDIAGP